MQQADNRRPEPLETELDDVLRRFFQAELPLEMPPLPAASASEVRKPWYRRAAWDRYAMVVAAAAVLLVAVAQLAPNVLRRGGVKRNELTIKERDLREPKTRPRDEIMVDADASESIGSEPKYFTFERDVPLDYAVYKTAQGEVEQRTEVNWSVSAIFDPRTGEQIQVAIPTITISIHPLERK